MPIRFLWDNLADTATVTASSAASDYAASNIAIRWPTLTWRSTGVTSEWIKFNLGSAKSIRAIVIYNHNFQSGAMVHIQGNATDSWGAPTVDVTLTVTTKKVVYYWSAAQTYQWWRITIADAGNPDGYVEIGRVFLGPYLEPSRNYENVWDDEWVDPSMLEESSGGQASTDEKEGYKNFSLNFPSIKSPDNTYFDSMRQAVGIKKPLFVTLNPSDLTTTYYVRASAPWVIRHIYNNSLYQTALKLREEL